MLSSLICSGGGVGDRGGDDVGGGSKPCENCVDPSRPQQWVPDYRVLGKPVMRTRWMAGTTPHKSE